MHTGINTGLVVARRSDARAGDYALTGDAVNTAARLRSLAAPGEVVVSATTWQQVSDYFDAERRRRSRSKARSGRSSPTASAASGRRRPAATALVGRDEELRDFRAVAEACAERRRSRVVVVRGDPGVGKSRLVAEFVAIARGSASRATPRRCSTSARKPAATRCAASRAACSASPAPPTRQRAGRRSSARARPRPMAAEQLLFLHDLLDVAPPPELRALAAAMSTAAREQGSLHALCDIVDRGRRDAPLLLVVEDIHWADAWTLERLAALAVLAARQPLLLVMTTRFAGDPTAGAWRTALHGAPLIGIDLGPLTTEDSHRLAALASTMPPALVASCVERAEGNPLFLLQLLLDAGEAAQTEPARLDPGARPHPHGPARRRRQGGAAGGPVLGQRFAMEALRHLLEPRRLRPASAGRALPRPRRTAASSCSATRSSATAPTHRCCTSAGAPCTRAPPSGSRARDLVLAAEHFDRAEDPRAAAAYSTPATRSRSSFATPRRWRWSSAASRSPRRRRRASPC